MLLSLSDTTLLYFALRLLNSVSQKTQEGDIFNSTLLGAFRKGMPTRIANSEDRAFEEVHHAFLFVLIGLISEIVECENRTISGKYSPDQRCSIQIVSARALLYVVNQRFCCREDGLPVISIKEKIPRNVQNARMKI